MLKIIFLLPLLLSFAWFAYLVTQGYSLSQGKQGFLYILIFSAVIGGFYTLMLWLTH